MKKIKFAMLLVLATTLTLFTSCVKNDNGEDYLQAFGTIETIGSSATMVFSNDLGGKIYITKSDIKLDDEYEGMKGCLTYVPIENESVSGSDVQNARLVFIELIETKDAELYEGESDEELFDEYGSPKISVATAWLGGTHLNIMYNVGYDNVTDKRKISLLIDESKLGGMTVYGKLYYQVEGANTDYFFPNYGIGLISFDLKKYITHVPSLAAFNIEFADAKTGKVDDFDAKYQGVEVNPVAVVKSL